MGLKDMQVAPNLKRSEFLCKCNNGCGFMAVDITLVTIAQLLRNKFGICIVLSGCRCQKHNKEVGGHHNSYHTKGMAVDISFKNGNVHEWERAINEFGFGEWVQVVKYEDDNFIHVELDMN